MTHTNPNLWPEQPVKPVTTEPNEPRCKCKPLNDELMYTGNCPVHQAKMEVSTEALMKSESPEAKAVLEWHRSQTNKTIQRVKKELEDRAQMFYFLGDNTTKYDAVQLSIVRELLDKEISE